jgi:PASTA domain
LNAKKLLVSSVCLVAVASSEMACSSDPDVAGGRGVFEAPRVTVVAVPNLVGLSLSEARKRVSFLGLQLAVVGATDGSVVDRQQPRPGRRVVPPTVITVQI